MCGEWGEVWFSGTGFRYGERAMVNDHLISRAAGQGESIDDPHVFPQGLHEKGGAEEVTVLFTDSKRV